MMLSFTITRYTDKETLTEYLAELLDSGFTSMMRDNKIVFEGMGKIMIDIKSGKLCLNLTSN